MGSGKWGKKIEEAKSDWTVGPPGKIKKAAKGYMWLSGGEHHTLFCSRQLVSCRKRCKSSYGKGVRAL